MSAPSSPVDRARTAQAEHEERHAMWRAHVRFCRRCIRGHRCRTASMLADEADAAGWRWQEAERRARGSRG